jgi:hypothetical protein
MLETKGQIFESDDNGIVFETEQLIDEENAGFAIDWNFHDPELYQLVVEWRRTEKEIENLRQWRMQAFIKGWMEK